jgi:predicted transcriptional regulator
MTKLLQRALEEVSKLPADSQDEIARAMLSLAGNDGEPEAISPDDLSAVMEGLAQARRGEFATDEEVEAALRRFDR